MQTTKSSLLNIARWNRPLILAGLITLFSGATPRSAVAGWAWPWQAGDLQAEAQREHAAAIVNEQRAETAEHKSEIA